MDYKRYLEILTSKPIPKELAFTEQEYRGRVERARRVLAEKNLDAMLVTDVANVCYLSGYNSFVPDAFACLVLAGSGEPTLQVAEFEIPAALLYSWVVDVRATKFHDAGAIGRELTGTLEERKLDGKRIGVETGLLGLNVNVYESLKRALPNATFVDASEVVFGLRLVKSPAELGHMRKAGGIVKTCLEATLQSVRAGASENDIASVAYATLVRQGSEYFSSQPMVAVGSRSGWIHVSQRGNRIKPGDTVMMELGAFVQRYLGAMMHTAVVGEPSAQVLRLVKASHGALNLVQQSVRPGRTAHDVAVEVKRGLADVLDEAYSIGMFGYAVGLSFPPNWTEGNFMIAEGVHRPMLPGMVFLTPVTLRIPGVLGIGFTDIFTVTETGCEPIISRDRSLTVIPA